MNSNRTLSSLKTDSTFYNLNKKISNKSSLSENECSYCLSCAILLIKEFDNDRRKTSLLEFGYYLILHYTLQTKNYYPLFDLSTNLGFYPISKFILKNNLIEKNNINSYFIENALHKFNHNGITETLEQKKYRNELVKSDARDNCYIAPTSFGKSSMMIDLIMELSAKKIFIIVPTKSLLTQTYKLISSQFSDRKVIFHDEMYTEQKDFIAIFTQERALRLLKNNSDMTIDALLIDEAHNLFECSSRSILLSRLIRRIRARKFDSKIFYFSPLICDGNNLKFEEQQNIETRKIQFNIKEAEINEYRLDGSIYRYNRFINEFFECGKSQDIFNYILENSKQNNFLYLRSPKMVERFSRQLSKKLPELDNHELNKLASTISKNVHEDFYCVDLVKKGVLYIHGKLPDLIKEYLEHKFKTHKSLKFIIANSVILEGVNLPIDNLYILNTFSMDPKQLTNLIGRVNRLNEVFSNESRHLDKLVPSIHFVNSNEFNSGSKSMTKKIESLRPGALKDEVNNPTLLKFDISKYDKTISESTSASSVETAKKNKRNALTIINQESFIVKEPDTISERMKVQFFESSISSIYSNPELAFKKIIIQLGKLKLHLTNIPDPIDKINFIFILEQEHNIIDYSLLRLQNEKARNYYRTFISMSHSLTLKEHIKSTLIYFKSIINGGGDTLFYMGSSYGELPKNTDDKVNAYVDLSKKSNKELANLALVKIKMEGDFVSYRLNEYITLLKEYGAISENEYNMFIYGTTKKRNTELTRLGLSGAIIRMLENDEQIENISIDSYGRVSVNDAFVDYLEKKDDLIKFEINKFILT